ncbi:MAG: peptide ABC transporter substrate-binding protein, partial [Chloroflexota bacterium]
APRPFRRMAFRAPYTLDPGLTGDSISSGYIENLFGGLLTLTPDLSLAPDIALRWEVLENGLRYVFYLRSDVKWSDGETTTAHDFVLLFQRLFTAVPDSQIGNMTINYFDIKNAQAYYEEQITDFEQVGVKAFDDFTLEFRLENPCAYFIQMLANSCYPIPRHAVEKFGDAWSESENIINNGPFLLEQYNEEKNVLLVKNPDYYGAFPGNLQAVDIQYSTDDQAHYDNYRNHKTDFSILGQFPVAEFTSARHKYNQDFSLVSTLSTAFLYFNHLRPPFNDINLRRALVLSTNLNLLDQLYFGGTLGVADGGVIPPGMAGHSPGIGFAYAPEKARRLLAEAGFPNGKGLPSLIVAMADGFYPEVKEYFQEQWLEILGIQSTYETIDFATMQEVKKNSPHIAMNGWVADYPDPDTFTRSINWPARTGWRNAEFETLVEQARRTMDQGERINMYQQADKILMREVAAWPMVYPPRGFLVKPWVKRFPFSSIYNTPRYKDIILDPDLEE